MVRGNGPSGSAVVFAITFVRMINAKGSLIIAKARNEMSSSVQLGRYIASWDSCSSSLCLNSIIAINKRTRLINKTCEAQGGRRGGISIGLLLLLPSNKMNSISAASSPSPSQNSNRNSSMGSDYDFSKYTELHRPEDFNALTSPMDGYFTVCGFGSLLSERSTRATFPEPRNFRMAALRDFRRVYAHVANVFYDRGVAKEDTKEISSLSVEPCPGEYIIITVFEIQKTEAAAFINREPEFRYILVICARYSDEEFFHVRCQGDKDIYFKHFGRLNIFKIWRDDVLPCRVYLRHCVLAARNLNEEAYNNFLDHTFLADRKTTIREYLANAGSGVMEEEPSESVRGRYDG
ncbi:uncharacterized protein LOC18432782 isoform X2 [Amborella trichopoda]|uniref:uncharacterized protein LOC18432782 isoform X2 n=1 Tax=Amborella trichopoda TaxID=13333 RepID=UPI0005D2DBA1|nr:uncharacterized protein LOC18432782 isoform X2 [Amborella trichopoda]|eukprot:XP_011622831.1 uncharacterized protein LOC18432782 isoform X2 [Amborella trichopoda]